MSYICLYIVLNRNYRQAGESGEFHGILFSLESAKRIIYFYKNEKC
jgi:hypothetical protein